MTSTINISKIILCDNKIAKAHTAKYTSITVNAPAILSSWKSSVFSYEWLLPDGRIKDMGELPEKEQHKRQQIQAAIQKGEEIEKPVLGIGLMENVEIGAGKAAFLTLAAAGMKTIPVHIPKSNESDFKAYLSKVE